eukprot:5187290-Pyramimonas_sp.AAC.1
MSAFAEFAALDKGLRSNLPGQQCEAILMFEPLLQRGAQVRSLIAVFMATPYHAQKRRVTKYRDMRSDTMRDGCERQDANSSNNIGSLVIVRNRQRLAPGNRRPLRYVKTIDDSVCGRKPMNAASETHTSQHS